MWDVQSEKLLSARGQRFVVSLDRRPATVGEIIHAWQNDDSFRSQLITTLADLPYSAFRWETPVVTATTVGQPFEFVVLDSPGLARVPAPEAFVEHFANAVAGVAVFPNLGGDSLMVVPCPLTISSAYGHLAAFLRLAPEAQKHALWQSVGAAMARRIGGKPVWLSTAGGGVSWLHVRLDDRPKYYGHVPYKHWHNAPIHGP